MKSIFKHKSIFYLLAFFLPFTIMVIILSTQGIWWGSDTTILASDGFHQYVIFHQTLRNALHGNSSIFYTFTSGLGLNFYALSSYYLGSFLSPLVYFFDLQSMPDYIYLSTIVKFGLIGLSTYTSLRGIYKNIKTEWSLLLSTSLALMSFSTSQLEISSWLDVFILVPIILLSLHRMLTGKGRIIYYISLACLFIQNYYFGYMTAIFLLIWTLAQLTKFDKKIIRFIDFTVVSIMSTLTAMVMLLPTYLDLKTHGETFTKIVNLKTEDSWYLDFFAKSLVGSFDTTKFGSIPMIFVGLTPLILALLYFTVKEIKWQTKLANGLLVTFIIASFYLQPLNLFWQGMHAPNMFLYRYAWVLSIVIIYLAAETSTYLTNIKIWQICLPFTILSTGFILTYIFKNHYYFLDTVNFLLSFEFLFAYLVLFVSLHYFKFDIKWIPLSFLLFTLLELGLHTHYQVQGISDEWHFPSRSNYEEKLTDIDNLVKETESDNEYFYRMERLLPQTGNDSMKFNYNGISQFSSIRNRASSSTLDKMGFRSDGTNLNLRYQNNTLIADSLFGITYNLASTNPNKYEFDFQKSTDSISLYKNNYSQGLALLTNSVYKDIKFTNMSLDNQSVFLNELTGLDYKYFYQIKDVQSFNGVDLGGRITVNKPVNQTDATITYKLNVPANSQVYLNLPNISFSNDSVKRVVITVNNLSNEFTLDNSFSFFNIGYFLEDTELSFSIHFPENEQVSFDKPQFFRLDLGQYSEAMEILASKQVVSTVKSNKVEVEFSSQNPASLLLTLPYDKGWTASIDGKKVPILKAQNGFMKLDVEPGQRQAVLTFIPHGFYLGLGISTTAICFFIFYNYLFNRHKNRG
ncbi:YfhO family protein [Streptococcus suis]|uniref:YfhO family protein n=1 Tax=Streptococcus suis TaxID=1307 RepID=UPI000CF559EB|nr:YfhO family protein [Streptococcus suis]